MTLVMVCKNITDFVYHKRLKKAIRKDKIDIKMNYFHLNEQTQEREKITQTVRGKNL